MTGHRRALPPVTVTSSRLHAGIWHAVLDHAGTIAPELHASHDGRPLPGLRCDRAADGTWHVALPVPSAVLNEGVQVVMLHDGAGVCLASLPMLCGAALGGDIRAEIALLRGELDVLKAAFRRSAQR